MTRRLDARTASVLAVLFLCATLGLMVGGAPAVMVWCFALSTVLAGIQAMLPRR